MPSDTPSNCRDAILSRQVCADPKQCPCDTPKQCRVAGSTEDVYACTTDVTDQPTVYGYMRGRSERIMASRDKA